MKKDGKYPDFKTFTSFVDADADFFRFLMQSNFFLSRSKGNRNDGSTRSKS